MQCCCTKRLVGGLLLCSLTILYKFLNIRHGRIRSIHDCLIFHTTLSFRDRSYTRDKNESGITNAYRIYTRPSTPAHVMSLPQQLHLPTSRLPTSHNCPSPSTFFPLLPAAFHPSFVSAPIWLTKWYLRLRLIQVARALFPCLIS